MFSASFFSVNLLFEFCVFQIFMARTGTISTLALAIAVSCVLLLDEIDVGFCNCLESCGVDSSQTFWVALLAVPSFFLGKTKVLSDRHLFVIDSSKLDSPVKNKVTELEVFKGPEAYLNLAIICALGCKEPQTTRGICKKVNQFNFRKQFSYSTVNRRVRRLEEHFYVKKCRVEKELVE